MLQWVQRPITLVMLVVGIEAKDIIRASMGPASDNAGYDPAAFNGAPAVTALQWVQRPITLVMLVALGLERDRRPVASMGPASDNAGYGATARIGRAKPPCF